MALSEQLTTTICDGLAEQGHLVLEQVLPSTLTLQLSDYVQTIAERQFSPAAIGRDREKQHLQQVRNDQTIWLSEDKPLEHAYLNFMDQLRVNLNQCLFLGLRDFEAHFFSL